MASGAELIISTLCNATLCGATNATALNSIFVPTDTNRWSELERNEHRWSISALAKKLNGKHLRVATYVNQPMSYVSRTANGTLLGRGVAFFVLKILRQKFNFTYEIVLPKRNFVMGGSSPEDSLVGLVSTGKVDMAAAFVPNILEFRKLVFFSIDLDQEMWLMMMKRPAESAVGEGLLAPFTQRVWHLILIAVIMFGPCITILTRIRAKLVPVYEPPISLYNSLWFVYGAFIKQGSRLKPKATSTRVLFITWWWFIMLVSTYYTANMTAFLTLSDFTLDIKDPSDLYMHNIPWIATEGSAVQFTVSSPQTEEMYHLQEMVKRNRAQFYDSTNITEYLRLVDKGHVLVKSYNSIVHGIYSDYMAKTRQGVPEENRCTYVIAPNPFLKDLRGFIYPKNSQLKPLFDRVLGIINQAGLVDFLKTRRLPSTRMCPMNLQSKERQLQNTDLLMTYKVTIGGMCVAIAVFFGEIIFQRIFNAKCTKKIKGQKERRTKFNKATTVHYFQENDSQPPPYDAIFGKASKVKLAKNAYKKIINGREYLVVNTSKGIRLVPLRTPSALLYKVENFK